jgi:hypothetical protein
MVEMSPLSKAPHKPSRLQAKRAGSYRLGSSHYKTSREPDKPAYAVAWLVPQLGSLACIFFFEENKSKNGPGDVFLKKNGPGDVFFEEKRSR